MTTRGRKPLGTTAMTAAERAAKSRYNRTFTAEGYSGKQISVMLSGEAHQALDDLLDMYSDKSQKEIIELALLKLRNK